MHFRLQQIFSQEPTALFKIIELLANKMFALIKQSTITQIKLHSRYNINMIKYLLLSKLLCPDINNTIINKLFWLEINDVFTCNSEVISRRGKIIFSYENKKRFQNAIKQHPCDWIFS